MRNYHSISDALEAVVNGDIEGVLLDRLPAVSYVRNLYGDQLKIEGVPLNDLGLHLVVPKGRNPRSSAQFEKGLEYLIKKKRLEALLKKWHLQE
jgi:ABC-type amino acid transport substrate-binding protein